MANVERCPSCGVAKYSAARSTDGLCDECAGRPVIRAAETVDGRQLAPDVLVRLDAVAVAIALCNQLALWETENQPAIYFDALATDWPEGTRLLSVPEENHPDPEPTFRQLIQTYMGLMLRVDTADREEVPS